LLYRGAGDDDDDDDDDDDESVAMNEDEPKLAIVK
jgi:hypothetical protein